MVITGSRPPISIEAPGALRCSVLDMGGALIDLGGALIDLGGALRCSPHAPHRFGIARHASTVMAGLPAKSLMVFVNCGNDVFTHSTSSMTVSESATRAATV